MENKKNQKIIKIVFPIIGIIGIVILIFAILKNRQTSSKEESKQSNPKEYVQQVSNNEVEAKELDTKNELINYIEIEMPNLIGKEYMDLYYRYNLKNEILQQLLTKELEGTTFNLNTLKYLQDGSILMNGFYIIEGYGYEVEKQKPEAGTKIKIMNDGEGNVSLGEDIYVYIKGGGTTQKVEIDIDKRESTSSNKVNESNEEDHSFSLNPARNE